MSFYPYLMFSGDCADAFKRYHEIFGGELNVMTQADVPDDVEQMPGADPNMVMHASLALGDGLLMGSDDPTGDGGPKVGITVAYTASDEETASRVFDALSEGGSVTLPLQATFFSKAFGMCTDAFEIPWMVDTAGEP